MIDTKAMADELQQARSARMAAEDAWCDVEELLWKVQRGPRYWRHLTADTVPDEPAALAH